MIVDSGATVTVMNPENAKQYAVTPGAASRAGVMYQVANGDEIENLGEKFIPVVTDEGTTRGVRTQIANVSRPLGAVRQMYQSGHLVVFDGPDRFCVHKETGEVNHIKDDGVNYTMGMWVIPKSELGMLNEQGFPWPAQ